MNWRLVRKQLFTLWTGTLSTLFVTATGIAHEGHETPHSDGGSGVGALPVALLASSALMLGATVYLYQNEDVEETYTAAGLVMSVGGLVAALALYLF